MARTACSFSVLPPGPTTLQSGYQLEGTLTTTTGKWATRSTGSPIVDPSGLGRWSGLCYQGRQNKKRAIVTAYRSPRQSPTEGGYGFYDQQYALLLSQGVKKPQVQKQFILDLTVAIKKASYLWMQMRQWAKTAFTSSSALRITAPCWTFIAWARRFPPRHIPLARNDALILCLGQRVSSLSCARRAILHIQQWDTLHAPRPVHRS